LGFVIDSGSADVSVPVDVAMTLYRTGTVRDIDFLGSQTYRLADGSTVPSPTFRIRSLKVGNQEVHDVVASISNIKGGLLLGQSFLQKFTTWSIDNQRHILVLGAEPPPGMETEPAYTAPATAPAVAPAAAPATVPAAVSGAASTAASQPMSSAQQAASTTQAYAEGHADRVAWENWFNTQSGSARSGAEYWSGVRSTAHPAPCTAVNSDPAFVAGCEAAQQRLASVDVRRKTEANYWWGWNSV